MRRPAKLFLFFVFLFSGCNEDGGVLDPDSIDEQQLDFEIADGVVVVDSTVLYLQSDSVERASGVFRFRILSSPPNIVSANIVVGAQGEGFLRRVVSVTQSQDNIVLNTSPAALSDAIKRGSFSFSVPVSSFSPASSPSQDHGVSREVVRADYLFPGASLTSAGISLNNVVLVDNPGCPSFSQSLDCVESRVELLRGLVNINHNLDVSGVFEASQSKDFAFSVNGGLDFEVLVGISSDGAFEHTRNIKLASFISQPFHFIVGGFPIVGVAKLNLVASLAASANGPTSAQVGFESHNSLRAGLEYKENIFSPIFEPEGSFVSAPLVWSGVGSADITLSVRPEFSVVFYQIGGPFINAGPYLKFTGATGRVDWQAQLSAGVSMNVGAGLEALSFSIARWSHQATSTETILSQESGPVDRTWASSGLIAHTFGEVFAGGPSRLYSVGVSMSGEDLLIGMIREPDGSYPIISDMAVSPTGELWGVSYDHLYRIDPSSAIATRVGSEEFTIDQINALAFSPDGRLFAATFELGALLEFNIATGEVDIIGPYGVGFGSSGDLAFSSNGTLFGVVSRGDDGDFLATIDLSTANATLINPSGSIGFENIWGINFVGDNLYGLTADLSYSAYGSLIFINTNKGVATPVRKLSFDAFGGALISPPGR